MGNAVENGISTIKGFVSGNKEDVGKTAAEAEAKLKILTSMAQKQREIYLARLDAYYQNADQFKKYQIAGGRQIKRSSFIGCETDIKAQTDITEGVDGIIDGLFSIKAKKKKKQKGDKKAEPTAEPTAKPTDDNKEEKAKPDDDSNNTKDIFHSAVKSLVSAAFNGILGKAEAGEHEDIRFFIVPVGFVFYRVDVFLWKWNVSATSGLLTQTGSITVAVAGCGILETKDLRDDELIGFVQDIHGIDDVESIKKWFVQRTQLGQSVKKLREELNATPSPSNNTDEEAANSGNKPN